MIKLSKSSDPIVKTRSLIIFHSAQFPQGHPIFRVEEFQFVAVAKPEDLKAYRTGILLFDQALSNAESQVKQWKNSVHGFLAVISEEGLQEGDFLVPPSWPKSFCLKALEAIVREMGTRSGRELLNDELVRERGKMLQLTNIGLALSAQTQLSKLLDMILAEGRSFAQCDAASLFLVEKNEDREEELVFKLTQNDSVNAPFHELRFPIDEKSIAGFVAVTGRTLNIPDVYDLNGEHPYRFNKTFDQEVGYRSRSMLTIPMKNHQQEVIGVLQFINRKRDKNTSLVDKQTTLLNTIPFSRDLIVLLEALASQAAVAIDNSLLLRRIKRLFEGFVSAAVTAIEQRDPTTSGHSFRVAELTTRMAQLVSRSGIKKFKHFRPNSDELREIRYASLLHDFGKVGVREGVLLKKKKLPENHLDLIWHRFELRKQQLRNLALEKQIAFIAEHGKEAYYRSLPDFERVLNTELAKIETYYQAVAKANEPTVLEEGNFKNLELILKEKPFVVRDRTLTMLSHDEFLALSIRRGNLTPEERFEIQNHVVHTYNFLKEIPWTPELQRIPELAVAHHEKINGSGYPYGMIGEAIPIPSKMMTVADIYDALTASDRPYKRSLSAEKALAILEDESDRGLLDPDLVKIFIEAKIYRSTQAASQEAAHGAQESENLFQHHVCDHDLDPMTTS